MSYAQGPGAPAAGLKPTATTWRVTSETLALPGGEKMGMVGGDLMVDVSDRLRLGVGSYGAVRGDRGGFITLGLAGEFRQRLSPNWLAHTGLFVGAGGGRGGTSALTGGGLMLRGDAGLTYEVPNVGNFAFGVSHVQFPSGVIRSTQPYLRYEYPFYSLLSPGWDNPSRPSTADAASVSSRHNEFALLARAYKFPAGALRDDGKPQHSSMQLVGVEWLSYLDPHWFIKLESEGAMGGQSSGYMQILAGAGYRMPLWRGRAIKLHVAGGPAGGSGADTGGGLLLDAGVALQQNLSERTSLEFSLGEVRAPSSSFRAQSAALKLSYQFGLPAVSAPPVAWSALGGFDAENLRVRVANQTYFKASPQWRNRYVDQAVSNLGVQLDYFVSPQWFVTGQGLAAYAGEAGAYMTGQVGVGVQGQLSRRWFAEGEALVGAAGGGGLAAGGGLVGQVNGSIGYRWTKQVSVLATAGRIQALRGDLQANVAGLSVAYQFNGFIQK
ncbi:hypothetical protein [Rhodoferax sp.]|uniref:hypothetical protein n=1 Tax=Rhodoferax sp. TaxID=50421 RepID=UPI0025E874C7|nr:hypothetical protein [Rhodoferax sp.]